MCAVPVEAKRGCGNPLELELQMIVNHHLGAGNQSWVLCKSTKDF